MVLQASHSCAFPWTWMGRCRGSPNGPALQRCALRTRSASGAQWPAALFSPPATPVNSGPQRGAGNGRSVTQEPTEDHRKRKEDPPKSSSACPDTRQSEQDIKEPPGDAEEPKEDPGESE